MAHLNISCRIIELDRPEARAESEVSLTPEAAFQVLTLYWFSLKQAHTYAHARGGEFTP